MAGWYYHAVTASEIYNSRLEQHLGDALGVRFTDRPARDASKRPVREIAGVAAELLELWSQRSTSIRAELATLTRQFQAETAGTLTHWIPTVDGDWLGRVTYTLRYVDGREPLQLRDQLVPAYALRPRTGTATTSTTTRIL